jgi:hypothetical protein
VKRCGYGSEGKIGIAGEGGKVKVKESGGKER